MPEVEVLRRHLSLLIRGKRIRAVEVRRERVLARTPLPVFVRTLKGARFQKLKRRGKYLLFEMKAAGRAEPFTLIGHLGMTGRMYLLPRKAKIPKHAAVVFDLGREQFVFEDTRYFGRLTLDTSAIAKLGPEPLGKEFTPEVFGQALKRSGQPIKVKLLDQAVVAGVGNIYASEALFRAGISPFRHADLLKAGEVSRLWAALRRVLIEAIKWGSTAPLGFGKNGKNDRLFYFGSSADALISYEERLRVYDRAGKPCLRCRSKIVRSVQAARSTFHCEQCQPATKRRAKSV